MSKFYIYKKIIIYFYIAKKAFIIKINLFNIKENINNKKLLFKILIKSYKIY